MRDRLPPADVALLDVLRKAGDRSVSDLAQALGVTATAVRQRLGRLLAGGLIERTLVRSGRGRPSHAYQLTDAGRRKAGANFGDLAVALWQEVRQIQDPEIRRGLLQRLAGRMAESHEQEMAGETLAERMESLAEMYRRRDVPFEVDASGELPVLTALACPYPGLAEQDRTVCSMEKLLFQELLGENVRLSGCRLDGQDCCTFEPSL